MIRMSTLVPLPKFNIDELGKVMADSRVRAFSPVVGQDYSSFNEDHGYTEQAPVSTRGSAPVTNFDTGADDTPPTAGVMTSEADSIPPEQSEKLFKALKLTTTKVSPEQFHMGVNVELEHYNITHGDLKKIALIALAHLAEDPEYYTKLQQMEEPESGPTNENRMSLTYLLKSATK